MLHRALIVLLATLVIAAPAEAAVSAQVAVSGQRLVVTLKGVKARAVTLVARGKSYKLTKSGAKWRSQPIANVGALAGTAVKIKVRPEEGRDQDAFGHRARERSRANAAGDDRTPRRLRAQLRCSRRPPRPRRGTPRSTRSRATSPTRASRTAQPDGRTAVLTRSVTRSSPTAPRGTATRRQHRARTFTPSATSRASAAPSTPRTVRGASSTTSTRMTRRCSTRGRCPPPA